MNIQSALFGALASAAVFVVGAAQASTITFDDTVGNSILNTAISTFSDGGLTFTSHGTYMYVWDGSSPNSNGSNNLIFAGFNGGDYLAITKTGGGSFDLLNLDLTISWYDGNASEIITVNGSPQTISQTLTNYNLNLVGVTELDISGVPSNSGYWSADNIVTNVSGVPEPSTWTALLLGFVGLGFLYHGKARGDRIALT
jgi:hypothetical protein